MLKIVEQGEQCPNSLSMKMEPTKRFQMDDFVDVEFVDAVILSIESEWVHFSIGKIFVMFQR